MTTTTTTRVSELRDGSVRTYEFDPLELIGDYADPGALAGGDPETNARITRAVLVGETGPCRDIVCLNAAAAILAGDKADNLPQGWGLAQKSIDSGKALEALGRLVDESQLGDE